MIIGHERVREALEANLLPATLIAGPRSVGKRTLARHLVTHHEVGAYDLSHLSVLTVEAVRRMKPFMSTAPFGAFRLALIDLDEASNQAQNALLKVLEEPPATARFLLTASRAVLPTIASRCQKHRLGYLTQDEVTQVLISLGTPADRARKAAMFSGGQVRPALDGDRRAETQRANVTNLIKAIALGDTDGFRDVFSTWDTQSSELLTTWFTEAITKQWLIFTAEEAYGLDADRDRLMHMIAALSRVASANPRLQARAALEPFVGR